VTGLTRLAVIGLVLLAVGAVVALVAFASVSCPVATEAASCPDATRNRVVVVALAGIAVALLITPFAFLGEFLARRRIVYRGAWWRAARRGILVGGAVTAMAALRLGGAMTVPVAIFIGLLSAALEWFASVMLDQT
jgi:hypothetical protein